MNRGMLSYNTYVRCTQKTLTCPAGGIARAEYSGGVSRMTAGESDLCISSSSIASDKKTLIELGFFRCVNGLLAAGALPRALLVHIHIPTSMEEQRLREDLAFLDGLCTSRGMTLLPETLEVTGAADIPCFAFSALGNLTQERRKPEPGDALLQAGSPGHWGTALLLELQRERLMTRFSESFLLQARDRLSCPELSRIVEALRGADGHILPLAEGGLMAALWNLKTGGGVGFRADLRAVPMEQEVVEICEFLEANPYQLAGDGAALVAVRNPEPVLKALREAGVMAGVIGAVTVGPGGNIKKDDEISSVSRPEPDPLFRFL